MKMNKIIEILPFAIDDIIYRSNSLKQMIFYLENYLEILKICIIEEKDKKR